MPSWLSCLQGFRLGIEWPASNPKGRSIVSQSSTIDASFNPCAKHGFKICLTLHTG